MLLCTILPTEARKGFIIHKQTNKHTHRQTPARIQASHFAETVSKRQLHHLKSPERSLSFRSLCRVHAPKRAQSCLLLCKWLSWNACIRNVRMLEWSFELLTAEVSFYDFTWRSWWLCVMFDAYIYVCLFRSLSSATHLNTVCMPLCMRACVRLCVPLSPSIIQGLRPDVAPTSSCKSYTDCKPYYPTALVGRRFCHCLVHVVRLVANRQRKELCDTSLPGDVWWLDGQQWHTFINNRPPSNIEPNSEFALFLPYFIKSPCYTCILTNGRTHTPAHPNTSQSAPATVLHGGWVATFPQLWTPIPLSAGQFQTHRFTMPPVMCASVVTSKTFDGVVPRTPAYTHAVSLFRCRRWRRQRYALASFPLRTANSAWK